MELNVILYITVAFADATRAADGRRHTTIWKR